MPVSGSCSLRFEFRSSVLVLGALVSIKDTDVEFGLDFTVQGSCFRICITLTD